MANEDMNSLMERYIKQLIEFEKRNTSPRPSVESEQSDARANEREQTAERTPQQMPERMTERVPEQAEPMETPEGSGRTQTGTGQSNTVENEIHRPERLNDGALPQPRTVLRSPEELRSAPDLIPENTAEGREKYEEYKKTMPKKGFLRVETLSSNGLYPVGNSRVVVCKKLNGDNYCIYDRMTDASGIVDNLELPAPDKNLSMSPERNGMIPYATYDVYVEHPNFVKTIFENVPIFDGITSIQSVDMVPTVNSGTEPSPVRILESEPEQL
ncbi:MAG: hypothetical protein PUB85_08620 [Clostridia bacterium]|nr:hypothetical protein [Clostridia bacterium]